MPTTLYCQIRAGAGAFTNYGPAGRDELLSLDLNLGGPGVVGRGTVVLRTTQVIATWSEVQIFLSDGATMGNIYMGGFATNVSTSFMSKRATSVQRIVTLDVQDYNIMLDAMGEPYGSYVTDNGSTAFATQILRIARHVTNGGYTVDTINVNNSVSGTVDRLGDPGTGAHNMSWRQLNELVCNSLQVNVPTKRPLFHIGSAQYSATQLIPQLEVYDAALLSAAGSLYTFHDGSSLALGAIQVTGDFRYLKDGIDLQTYVKAWSQNSGYVNTADGRSSGYATYENPYNVRSGDVGGTWFKKSYQLQDGLSSSQVTAEKVRLLTNYENPRSTIEFDVEHASVTRPWPGTKVTIVWSTEGYSDASPLIQYIADCTVHWRSNIQTYPVYTLQVGSRILGLGEEDQGGTGRVSERDNAPPNPPTLLGAVYLPQGEDFTIVRLTWTASTSGDVRHYRLYGTIDGRAVREDLPEGNPIPVTTDYRVRSSATGTLTIGAVDHAGNLSLGNPSVTLTRADTEPLPTDTLYNPDGSIEDPASSVLAAGWYKISGNGSYSRGAPIQTIKGPYSLVLTCPAGETVTIESNKVSMYNPSTTEQSTIRRTVAGSHFYTTSTTGIYTTSVQPYNAAGTPLTLITVDSTNFATGGAQDSSHADADIVGQANQSYGRLRLTLNGGAAGCTVYVSGCKLQDAVTANNVSEQNIELYPHKQIDSAGASMAEFNSDSATGGFNIEDDPIRRVRSDGTWVGDEVYDNVLDEWVFEANPALPTKVRFKNGFIGWEIDQDNNLIRIYTSNGDIELIGAVTVDGGMYYVSGGTSRYPMPLTDGYGLILTDGYGNTLWGDSA